MYTVYLYSAKMATNCYKFPIFYALLAKYLSRVHAQKDSGTAASVSQPRLHGTPFPKIYMIAQYLC